MRDDPRARLRKNLTGITAMVVTGLWLSLLFLPLGPLDDLWLVVLLAGYLVVVPLVALLYGDEADRANWWIWSDDWGEEEWTSEAATSTQTETSRSRGQGHDPLERLRTRYAEGELTDEQFERKLDRLLETETLEDAEEWRNDARHERDRNLEYER